ncbi:MAG: 16S rRNA (adenine(1518)-N(6)/adenine(1519)-N(6))-dimethyltransferase RsmA [Thermoleophilia bacterium]
MGEEHNVASDRRRPPRPRALHRYGQNHLVDANILRAIVEQAAVLPGDVVLEVGAADGQLTRPLLARARLVHAFEIDRRFAHQLDELAQRHDTLRVHFGDALKQDLAALDPLPTALVANLAYNIAIPLLMTSIERLPSLRRWGVMVQKELADRLFAVPSTKAYSAVSVLAQVTCEAERSRAVPPSAFRPRPRVDSSFVTFHRREQGGVGQAEYKTLARLVRVAFGQRRKVLTNSLAGAVIAGSPLQRDDVRDALVAVSASPGARPEELAPAQWREFVRQLAGGPACSQAEL